MYESFFGFVKRPFLAVSTLDRYFPATSVEQACQTTSRAIARGEGPVAIFGGTGLGKTMCCLRVAENFRRNFEVVMLASSQIITRRALLQSLLFELRMPYREMSEGELRLTLMNRLQPSTENPTDGLVLIVDEAQTLSIKLLEELRLLTNVVRNGVPRVRLILCGSMRLEECLSHPLMDSLNQRLAARCYLTPLSMQETGMYVRHKIELSGVDSSTIMTQDSLEAIFRGSDGIPRLIDQLVDQSLLLACNDRERPVSAAMVGRAWCMLQQLPNPWSEPESIAKPKINEHFVAQSNVQTTKSAIASPVVASQIVTSSAIVSAAESPTVAQSFGATNRPTHVAPANVPTSPVNLSASSAGNADIEFGQLDEESDTSATIPVSEPTMQRNLPKTSQQTRNLLDTFAGDFDEEFTIPVQSSGSYNAYSGAAYGNLNHDLASFGTKQANAAKMPSYEFEEANDFLYNSLDQARNTLADSFGASGLNRRDAAAEPIPFDSEEESYPELVSNITPEQAANLERQIEEEMRDLVSGLNLSAMTFDPLQSIENKEQPQAVENRRDIGEQYLAHQAHSDVISFSGLRTRSNQDSYSREENTYSNESESFEQASMNDDRDLLVVEDDLEAVRNGVQQATTTVNRAVLHPYAKLFTKLRNS